MKSVKELITHLSNIPSYGRLKKNIETREFISLLGKSKNSIITYTFCKDETMYIAVSHPAFKQELNSDSSIKQIKSLLKKYCEVNENTALKDVKNIQITIQKPKEQKPIVKIKKDYSYLSRGEFENLAKDEIIHEIFEKIKEELKNAYK